MELFTNQILAGISTGAIYACMALAVVMIYQAIDHLNFAQGEMAMFSTFISWQLMQWGVPYWAAFVLTLAISFAGGIAIELHAGAECSQVFRGELAVQTGGLADGQLRQLAAVGGV